jgi:hypothetical protein
MMGIPRFPKVRIAARELFRCASSIRAVVPTVEVNASFIETDATWLGTGCFVRISKSLQAS